MALDVKVKIELSKTSGNAGFGIPLLLECGVESPVAYTECYSLDDVIAAGFDAKTEMYAAANMVFAQENRPEKVAICQATGTIAEALPTIVSKNWRQLVVVNGDISEYVAAADYIEATGSKMMFISIPMEDWASFKDSVKDKKYDRTVIFVNNTKNAAAALVGETSGRTAGSFTYKFKTLKNVAPEELTDTQINELHAGGAFGYVTKAGDDVTTEGIAQSGKYIDITDSIDYVIQNIEYRIQKTFNNSAKVPYDNRGIAKLESATTTALQEAGNIGIIAVMDDGVTYDYSTSFAARSATTEADRESRKYPYGAFRFSLAGAIHECEVNGEITY